MDAAGLFLSLLCHIILGLAGSVGCSGGVHLHFHELLDGNLDLHVFDYFVLFGARLGLDTLPRQTAHEEVQKHEAEALKIVSPSLLDANVRVETRIPGRSSQRFTIFERYVLA